MAERCTLKFDAGSYQVNYPYAFLRRGDMPVSGCATYVPVHLQIFLMDLQLVCELSWCMCRQVGVPNLLDKGVLRVGAERGLEAAVAAEWTFMDEIPFDFERRMLSVVLLPTTGLNRHPMLVCKVHPPLPPSCHLYVIHHRD